jgi:cell wall assembly regulator SMI1
MSEIERLKNEQLARLEELLSEQGAPVVPRLQPAATPEALTAVEDYLGRPLPLEVKQWWEWHDGTDIKPDERAVRGSIGPGFIFLRTERAVEDSRWRRNDAEDIEPESRICSGRGRGSRLIPSAGWRASAQFRPMLRCRS